MRWLVRIPAVVLGLQAVAAGAIELTPGTIYCVRDPLEPAAAHLIKIIEVDGTKVHTREYTRLPSCPAAIEDENLRESIPNPPVALDWFDRFAPVIVGRRTVSVEETEDVREMQRLARPLREPLNAGTFSKGRLARVRAPSYPPMFIVPESVDWSGSVVRFTYVLSRTAGNESDEEYAQSGSSAIEARIDCAAKTIATGKLRAFSGPEATGVVERESPGHSWDRWNPVKPPSASSSGAQYLADHFCK